MRIAVCLVAASLLFVARAPSFAEEQNLLQNEIAKIQKRGKEIAEYSEMEGQKFKTACELAKSLIAEGQDYYYSAKAFQEPDGNITVYLIPVSNNPETILIGGDFKVSISKDKSTVLNKTEIHKTILRTNKIPQQAVGSFHTHVLSGLPSETDVALTLQNPILAPMYIIGQTWMFKIDKEGKITLLGKTKEAMN
jgi:proteasome lid subunit RPN8/RPN11